MNDELDKEHQRTFTYHFFFVHGLYDQLKDIEDFVNATNIFLTDSLKEKASKENLNESINPRFSPEIQFENIFPDILWRTTFLHCYFLLEYSLDQVCKNIQQVENHKLKLNDINGNGIFRASVYLKKVCNIISPFETQNWAKLSDYNTLRNIFVHSDGVAQNVKKKIVEIAKRHPGLLIAIFDIDTLGIRFTKEFILSTIKTIEEFFNDLQQNMRQNKT